MSGLPACQFVADVTRFRIIKQFGHLKVELSSVMFDFLGYLENLKDVKSRLHHVTFLQGCSLSPEHHAFYNIKILDSEGKFNPIIKLIVLRWIVFLRWITPYLKTEFN